jgi:ribosomal protein S18 acetylase RimI-like enzyme
MSKPSYTIVARPPTVEEYGAICSAVGWDFYADPDRAARAITGSLFHIVALADGQAVGMGRIVGDGAIFFYLQDIAVLPAHQGRSLGTQITERLMAYLREHAPPGSMLGLFAAPHAVALYERYGFQRSESGMFQYTAFNESAAA